MKPGLLLRWIGLCHAGVLIFLCQPSLSHAQYRGGGRSSYMDDLDNQDYKWPVDAAFQGDVFTFARL